MQVQLQSPQGLSGTAQEVARAHVLIHHHESIRRIRWHLLDDVVAEGGQGVEGAKIWRCDIDVVGVNQMNDPA